MKEKTGDTEGHRIKVGLDQQHKSSSSSSSGKATQPAADSEIRNSSKQETSSRNPLFGVGNNSNQSNNSNNGGSNNNNNFDDDYNEWDISIGDLIIDLDADIEQSEGDKPTAAATANADSTSKSDSTTKTLLEGNKTVTLPNPKLFPDISDPVSVMSSNLKSNRSSSLSSGASAHSSLSASNSNSSLISAAATTPVAAVASTAPNTNGTNSSKPTPPTTTHHHGHNQRNAYSVSSNSSSSTAAANSSAITKNSLVEHHATVEKGLKMKIKRKSIGGKISETKHEIVSSDISPQACKPYIGSSFEPNSSTCNSNSMPPNVTALNNKSPDSNHGPNSTPLNSSNSVITANSDGVPSSLGDTSVLSTKSSKHSNKNKSAHRDKKDKSSKGDKEKVSLPVTTTSSCSLKARPTEETHDTAALPTSSQSGIPNLTLKYSTTSSPTVILKPEELNNRNAPNPSLNNPKKIKTDNVDDNISERRTVGTSTSISTITEPDCLGPCEPGTSVTLEGIVWQETEGGVLVVNVTWRGKTYVGTLLDCTKHDWAPPRFCESPTSDIESKSMKNTRGKRARSSFVADNTIDTRSVTSKLRNGKGRRTANSGYVPPSPAKSDSSISSSKRKGRPSDLDLTSLDDTAKRNRIAKPETPDVQAPCCSPVLIECPEPNCSKKYKHINGLKYHQSHAHIGSTFNINDSQEFDSTSEALVKDDSDGELNDSSLPEFGLKESLNSFDKMTSDVKIKPNDKCNSPADKTFNNTLNNNNTSPNVETKTLNNSANDLLLVSEPNNSDQVTEKSVDMFDLSSKSVGEATTTTANNSITGDAFTDTTKERNKVTGSDSTLSDLPGVFGADSGRDSVNIHRNVIFSSNGIDLSSGLAKSSSSSNSSNIKPASNANITQDDDEIKNVASPAYSDISDDTNTNDNPNELATLPSSQPIEKIEACVDLKKSTQAPSNFNISQFPPFFNQSPYLPPGSTCDTKSSAACTNDSTVKTASETSKPSITATITTTTTTTDKTADKTHNPYAHPFYRFGSIPPHDPKISAENLPKPNSGSLHAHPASGLTTNVNKTDPVHFHKDKSSESTKPASKENNDFNAGKQPIQELQNLKNRIQNFAFDQGPLYDTQKRFIAEGEKERSKEKTKHSPQHPKPPTGKEEKDKVSKNDEGVKPTMETTGPPPPTNGYYYNPTFLPHSFPQMGVSPFDSMLRASAMANHMVMGSPYGPPHGSSFLHPQMRFPPMGPMDGLSMPNVARSSSQSPSCGPSTSTTSVKSTAHHMSSSFATNSKPDRTILSPTSNSHNSSASSHLLSSANSYHKSPSKDFSGPMNPSSHGVVTSSPSDPRTSMAGPSSSLHQPRHPLHSAAHVGYPMFDPYSAMIVNHAVNSVPMHPYAPK